MQIWVEFAFCLVLFFLWFYLDRLRVRSVHLRITGWSELLWGVFFLFLGSILDVSENLTYLRRFLSIGTTDFSAIMKVGLYILGILLIIISPLNWLSILLARKMRDEDEEKREDFLQSLLGELKDKTTLSDLFSSAFPEIIGFVKAQKGAAFLISEQELILSFSTGFSKEEIDGLSKLEIDDDALSRCAKDGECKVVKSVTDSEKRLASLIRDEQIASLICAPLSGTKDVLGVLAVFSRTGFKEEDALLLSSIGKGMGKLIEYINSQAEIKSRSEMAASLESQRRLLLDLVDSIPEADTKEILDKIVLTGTQLAQSDSCKIFWIDLENNTAQVIASSDPACTGGIRVISESPEIREVVEKGEIVFKTFESTDGGTKSSLALPLYVRDEILGGLVFEFKEYSPESTEVEIDLLESLAGFASPILHRRFLPEEGEIEEKPPEEKKEYIQPKTPRILAVDDQKAMRDLLDDVSKKLGYQIELATDGRTGLQMFEEDKFDLVITELDMPGLTGWDLSRKVKSSKPEVLVALIAEMSVPARLTNKYGIDFVLIKPFRIDDLIQIIKKAEKRRAKSSTGAGAK